jgi:ADP-ribose pyrophosphatase YjhB (NUDIX family)
VTLRFSPVGPTYARPVHLPAEQWQQIERSVPITCVDVLAWQVRAGQREFALISRLDDTGRAKRWNLIGGRVRLDETLASAMERHVVETLGPDVSWTFDDFASPPAVEQYLRTPTDGVAYDPRHHAIALSYTFEVTGEFAAGGEAFEVGFFTEDALPPSSEIGFRQADVIYRLARAANATSVGGR